MADDVDLFAIYGGASYRHIVDLAKIENSVFVLPGGQSGVFNTTHYDDMLSLWYNGQYLE